LNIIISISLPFLPLEVERLVKWIFSKQSGEFKYANEYVQDAAPLVGMYSVFKAQATIEY